MVVSPCYALTCGWNCRSARAKCASAAPSLNSLRHSDGLPEGWRMDSTLSPSLVLPFSIPRLVRSRPCFVIPMKRWRRTVRQRSSERNTRCEVRSVMSSMMRGFEHRPRSITHRSGKTALHAFNRVFPEKCPLYDANVVFPAFCALCAANGSRRG